MKVLGIDSSKNTVSAAVIDEGIVMGQWNVRAPRRASSLIPQRIEDLLADLHMDIDSLEALSVTVGPGSYTGIRIATSLGSAVAIASEIPAVGIVSNRALGASISFKLLDYVVPVVSAGRGGTFTAIYETACEDEYNTLREIIPPALRGLSDTKQALSQQVPQSCSVGWIYDESGLVEDKDKDDRTFVTPVSAVAVARLGWVDLLTGAKGAPKSLKPRYFRKSSAEMNGGCDI